ncbi:Acg family FMN-binding oxidoreductase [Thiohalorhabdus sp.]|uniref:Acg family FMN-binding oxidoreductase n=1 Tax=Thiohalorhabdus sp. TaxID=3094134 RepID=UPI002FC28058
MAHDPWRVRESDYPSAGTTEQRLRFFLRYAVLAPSAHNSQPWRFRVADGRAYLYADRRRRLPIADPEDRELTISCGAALFHLRLAMRYFGQAETVEAAPDPEDPELLATVTLAGPHAPDDTDRSLFRAVPRRFTHRGPFQATPVPPALQNMMQSLAAHEGAGLHCLSGPETKGVVAALVAEGDRHQGGDPPFRRELADWLRTGLSRQRDGLHPRPLGVGLAMSLVLPAYLRWINWGPSQARQDRQWAREAPLLAVLTTARDGISCWLTAGQALAAVLLRAAEDGVQAAYLNQAVQVPELRQRLGEQLGGTGQPQVLLRLGYAGGTRRPAPRRPAELVIDG